MRTQKQNPMNDTEDFSIKTKQPHIQSQKEGALANSLRKSGINLIGDTPWGTHFCQFYQTKKDLIDILVPYFKAGLENNEFCMWITSEPLHVDEAKRALQKTVKNLDNHVKKRQIEILDATQWYTKSGKFNADEVLTGWVKKEAWARKKGFDGLRLTGNTFWLEKKDWDDFRKYEEVVNHVIGNYKMIAICSYSLDKCNASEIINVVSNHQFALIKRKGTWQRIESSERKRAEEKIILGTVHVARDINEQKQTEESLRETRDYLENLLNYANAPIIVWDTNFKIMRFNHAFEHLTGYTSDEVVGKKLFMLFPKASQRESLNKINQALHGEYWKSVEIPILHKDGSTRIALWNSANIYDNERKALVATIAQGQDITERKQIEQELVRLASFPENNPNPIIEIDFSGKIYYLNPKTKEMFPDIETTGFHHLFLKGIEFLISDSEKYGTNYPKNREIKVGDDYYLQTIYYVPENHRIRIYSTNVTGLKKAEENIRKLNESLLRHSIELSSTNKELEAFSYSVSHDLRAPLRSIDGFSQAMLEDFYDKLDEQGKDYLQRVRKATQRMGQLIDDMLRLSRLTRTELHLEEVDLTELSQTVLEKFETSEPSRKIKITVQKGMTTKGDKKLLEILLDNLIGNAWKFTSSNKSPVIQLGQITKGEETTYFICDNGVGFDMAYADKLFIPFQRLHGVDEYPGTGIGLAIVSRIVHRHGGRIWAEGEVRKGATFYFTLQKKE